MKHTRILSAILALLLLLPAMLGGCGKKAKNDAGLTEDGEPVILEHVFRGTAFPLPEKWNLNTGVPPIWKDGTLTCLASMTEEQEDTDGSIHYLQRTAVFTLTEAKSALAHQEQVVRAQSSQLHRKCVPGNSQHLVSANSAGNKNSLTLP